MSAYEALLKSNAWDGRFHLPAVPQHLNPHIYTAYAVRVLESLSLYSFYVAIGPTLPPPTVEDLKPVNENKEGTAVIREDYKTFLDSCEIKPGVITTYPYGGLSSHDDAYGAAFLNSNFAVRCISNLFHNDGVYAYEDGAPTIVKEEKNFYRFFFVTPALRAWAGERVGLVSQIAFAIALLFRVWFTRPGEGSGLLLIWLALPTMRKYEFVKPFAEYFEETWTKRGFTPKSIFKNNYLVECPWFAEYARDDWK